ncbi:MAG: HEAT repeat domain-containing protein [Acidobacteria bacterium]|nr:HEAT repeat domain-containing protein [Acidobacteriota bacterium]
MMKSLLLLSLLFAACISANAPYMASSETSAQNRSFINVDGPNLKSKWEAAIRQGSSQQKRFWVAYAFDVRPGIAFDAVIIGSGGSRTVINGSMVSSRFETRNVGIFLLHEKDGRSIVRAEIYNLERAREYAGYPVYWLGRGGAEESLNLLRSLIGTVGSIEAADRLTDAIGAHDDPRVAAILKDLIRNSRVERVRTTAVSWLGHLPGETSFLAALVRDERESVEVRKEAAEAIGESPDGEAPALLQTLYRSVAHREVKREILEAISDGRSEEQAVNFLIEVAEREQDRELRKEAIEGLGEKKDSRSLQALEKITNDSGAGSELQQAAVEAIAERPEDEALPLLKKIAMKHPGLAARREAIERLGEFPGQTSFLVELARNEGENLDLRREAVEAIAESRNAEAISILKQLYAAISNRELKQEIIESFEDCADRKSAIDFLLEVARGDSDRHAREQAFSTLGDMNDDRAIDALAQLYDTERNEELKAEILSALGDSNNGRSVKKLMEVAKGDPSIKLKKKAISLLGQRDDPEAVKFLEGLVR